MPSRVMLTPRLYPSLSCSHWLHATHRQPTHRPISCLQPSLFVVQLVEASSPSHRRDLRLCSTRVGFHRQTESCPAPSLSFSSYASRVQLECCSHHSAL